MCGVDRYGTCLWWSGRRFLGVSLRMVATRLGRAPLTISRELARNGGRVGYRAHHADRAAFRRARRRPRREWMRSEPLRRRATVSSPMTTLRGPARTTPCSARSPPSCEPARRTNTATVSNPSFGAGLAHRACRAHRCLLWLLVVGGCSHGTKSRWRTDAISADHSLALPCNDQVTGHGPAHVGAHMRYSPPGACLTRSADSQGSSV